MYDQFKRKSFTDRQTSGVKTVAGALPRIEVTGTPEVPSAVQMCIDGYRRNDWTAARRSGGRHQGRSSIAGFKRRASANSASASSSLPSSANTVPRLKWASA